MALENNIRKVELHRFEGNHRRMGRQQGEAASEIIHKSRDILLESEELELIKPRFMPGGIFIGIGEIVSWWKYEPHIRKHYPEQHRRLLGISRGAGVSPGFIFLLASFEVELNKVDYQIGGCSAAGITKDRSATGEPILIKNFDYPEHFTETHITRLDAPAGRFRTLNVSAAPLAGSHEGVNEHGLSITYNYGYGQDKSSHRIPLTIIVQEALETCKTTREAVDLISASKRCGGALLMICDAAGDLRTLEISNSRSAERMPENGLLINTNHYLDEEMAKIDVPLDAFYTQKSIKMLRGCNCRESTGKRYGRIEELLGKQDKIDEEKLIGVFSDHGTDNSPSDFTVCRHSAYFSTTCSVIIFPTRRTMKVMYAHPCSAEYQEFSFDG